MQQTPFNWGIIAPGRIARNFAQGLNVVDGARLAAVASRNAERARAFVNEQARAEDNTRVYDDYAHLVADPDIDAVYIANPHRFHFDAAKLALEAGKPVLCEKPLCVNAEQAEALIRLAKDQNVFLMEALWSRFLPVWQKTRAWLDEGQIGDVHTISSSFCMQVPRHENDRLLDINQAGGVLLDMGIYCVALSQFVMGKDPDNVQSLVYRGPTGVDERDAVQMAYDDVVSQFTCSFIGKRENRMRIEGTQGSIVLADPFWASESVTLNRLVGADGTRVSETFNGEHRASGFEYQIEEVMRCVRAGKLQSDTMPWAATLGNARVMDRVLAEGGVVYPFL